jgi:hypothetical protein
MKRKSAGTVESSPAPSIHGQSPAIQPPGRSPRPGGGSRPSPCPGHPSPATATRALPGHPRVFPPSRRSRDLPWIAIHPPIFPREKRYMHPASRIHRPRGVVPRPRHRPSPPPCNAPRCGTGSRPVTPRSTGETGHPRVYPAGNIDPATGNVSFLDPAPPATAVDPRRPARSMHPPPSRGKKVDRGPGCRAGDRPRHGVAGGAPVPCKFPLAMVSRWRR